VWEALDTKAATLLSMQQQLSGQQQQQQVEGELYNSSQELLLLLSEPKEIAIAMETSRDKYAYKREKTATSDPTEATIAPDDSSAYHLDLSEYISKYTMESCDNAFHRRNIATANGAGGGDDDDDANHTDALHQADEKPVAFLKSRFEEEFIVVTNALYHQSRSAHVPIITHPPVPITTKATSTTTKLIGRSHSSYGRSRAKVHKDDDNDEDDEDDDDTSTAYMRSQSASTRRIPSVHRGVQNSISSRIIINHDQPTARPVTSWHDRSSEGNHSVRDHSVGYITLDSNNWDTILPHRHMSNDPSAYPTSQQQSVDMILPTPSSVTESPRSKQPLTSPPSSSSAAAAATWNYTDLLTSHIKDRHNNSNNNSNKSTTASSLDSFNAPRQSHRMRGRKRSGYSSYDFDLLRREKLTPTGTKVIFNPDLGDRSRDHGDRSRDLGDRSRDLGDRSNDHSRDLGDRSRDHEDRSRDLGDRSRDLGDRSRDLGDRSRDLGDRSRDLGDRSRDHGDRSRDLGDRSRGHEDRSRDMVSVKYAPSLMLDGINDRGHLCVLDDDRDDDRDDDGLSLAGALYNMKSTPSKKLTMTRRGRRKRK
jgi:hypothetical protein